MRWLSKIYNSRWINLPLAGIWTGAAYDLAVLAYANFDIRARVTLLMGIMGCAFWAGTYLLTFLAGRSAMRALDDRLDRAANRVFEDRRRELEAIIDGAHRPTEDELHERAQRISYL